MSTLTLKAMPLREKSGEAAFYGELDFSPWALPRVRSHADLGPRSIAAYSTRRIAGVKWKKPGWVTCGTFFDFAEDVRGASFALAEVGFDFDRAILPWYGRGNFPIDKNLGVI
jgi:hypothetical protein